MSLINHVWPLGRGEAERGTALIKHVCRLTCTTLSLVVGIYSPKSDYVISFSFHRNIYIKRGLKPRVSVLKWGAPRSQSCIYGPETAVQGIFYPVNRECLAKPQRPHGNEALYTWMLGILEIARGSKGFGGNHPRNRSGGKGFCFFSLTWTCKY